MPRATRLGQPVDPDGLGQDDDAGARRGGPHPAHMSAQRLPAIRQIDEHQGRLQGSDERQCFLDGGRLVDDGERSVREIRRSPSRKSLLASINTIKSSTMRFLRNDPS